MPNLQRGGGGACLNFAHFSMQFCNPGDPKRGGGHDPMAPPKYAPGVLVYLYRLHFNVFASHAITLNVFFWPFLRLRREINNKCHLSESDILKIGANSTGLW